MSNSYVIKRGDTLSSIVKNRYNLNNSSDIEKYYKKIAEINHIANPNLIYTGASLELPSSLFEQAKIEEKSNNSQKTNQAGNGKDLHNSNNTNGKKQTAAQKYYNWLDTNTEDYDKLLNGTYTPPKNEPIGGRTYEMFDTKNLLKQDGTLDKNIYLNGTKKFTKSIYNSMNTDNKKGISLEEYTTAQKARQNGNEEKMWQESGNDKMTGMSWESWHKKTSENSFKFMDLNNDSIIDKKELQSIYAAYDVKDGSHDGKIQYGTLSIMPEDIPDARDFAINFKGQYLDTDA